MQLFRHLRLPFARKVGVACLFCAGWVCIIISSVRAWQLNKVVGQPDLQWLALWGTTETSVGKSTQCFFFYPRTARKRRRRINVFLRLLARNQTADLAICRKHKVVMTVSAPGIYRAVNALARTRRSRKSFNERRSHFNRRNRNGDVELTTSLQKSSIATTCISEPLQSHQRGDES